MSKGTDLASFRAEQLCLMHFNRSDEFKLVTNFHNEPLVRGVANPYLDFLFDISDGAFYKGYNFGVTLKAAKGYEKIDKLLLNFRTEPYTKMVFPVVLIIFDVTNDRGYYSWINLPVTLRKAPTAHQISEDSIKPFNSKALKDIFTKVDLFYYEVRDDWA